VICNEEDTDGRARVTTDEERVLPVDCVLCLSVSDHGGTAAVGWDDGSLAG